MNTVACRALGAALLSLAGCNNNNNAGSPQDGSVDTSVDQSAAGDTGAGETGARGGDGGVPPLPTLGMQIDRMGRPAVNTALNNAFDPSAAAQGMAKDRYNFDSDPADWAANWVPTFEQSLALFDGLDGVCGNQLAYASFGRPDYQSLAALIAADALWINTASATCTTYLAVELNVLGVTNDDCGGRALTYNVIDDTYNAVAGTFSPTSPPGPITNGVTMPSSPPSPTFPFLAKPH